MTQSHRKEPHVISSNTVITSCEKGRKWFLSSVLWIDAKFVGVMEPLRVRLFTAVAHPLYCGVLTELNFWKSIVLKTAGSCWCESLSIISSLRPLGFCTEIHSRGAMEELEIDC